MPMLELNPPVSKRLVAGVRGETKGLKSPNHRRKSCSNHSFRWIDNKNVYGCFYTGQKVGNQLSQRSVDEWEWELRMRASQIETCILRMLLFEEGSVPHGVGEAELKLDQRE